MSKLLSAIFSYFPRLCRWGSAMQNDVGIVPNGIGASDLDKNLVRQARRCPFLDIQPCPRIPDQGRLPLNLILPFCASITQDTLGVFDDFGISSVSSRIAL